MRRTLEKPTLEDFAQDNQRVRAALSSQLDDPFSVDAAWALAAAVARGERPSRFRDLRQLDALTEAQVTRWFDAPSIRVAFLLPEVGATGTKSVADVATSLHDLEVLHGPASDTQPPPLPVILRPFELTDYRLANGLRVLLAPDPAAFAVDARLVITGTRDDGGAGVDDQAAGNLLPKATSSVVEAMNWYRRIGAPVIGLAGENTTIFLIHGYELFADWHLWHLGVTVVQGGYSDDRLDKIRRGQRAADARRAKKQPSADAVVSRRLAGAADTSGKVTVHSAKTLAAFRRARYRPDASTLIVSGKFDVEAMKKEIDSLFGGWRAGDAAVAAASPKAPLVKSAVGIGVDDAPTVEISIAFAPTAEPPAQEAAARAVLRDMIDARMRVVREGLGASYGVYSMTSSAIRVSGDVEPAYAGEAAKAIADELARFRTGDASLIDDFVRARKRVLGYSLALPADASRRADALTRMVVRGGDIKQLAQEVETIRTLDFAAVQKIAARDMQPERMLSAVRGKKSAVEAALGALGIAKEKIVWLADPEAKGDKRTPAETPKWTDPPADRRVSTR